MKPNQENGHVENKDSPRPQESPMQDCEAPREQAGSWMEGYEVGFNAGQEVRAKHTLRMLEWVEPYGPANEPVHMSVTKETAIAWMKKAHPELSDDQALDEFIAVNWASWVGEAEAPHSNRGLETSSGIVEGHEVEGYGAAGAEFGQPAMPCGKQQRELEATEAPRQPPQESDIVRQLNQEVSELRQDCIRLNDELKRRDKCSYIGPMRDCPTHGELREAESLRLQESFKCKARSSNMGANDPQECNWPVCGCDPYADKVIAALQEHGILRESPHQPSPDLDVLVADLRNHYDTDWDTTVPGEEFNAEIKRIVTRHLGEQPEPAKGESE